MKNLICTLGLVWLTSMAFTRTQTLPDTPTVTDLLNYKPQKSIIGEKSRALLDAANWHDKAALDAISEDDLDGILRGQILTFKDRDNSNFPIIGAKKIVDLNHDGTYSIVLWLNDAVTMYFGVAIIEEAQQYSLYYFYRDISLEDLVGNGRLEIVVSEPIIYKPGIFFGSDPMPGVGWYDVFVLDGTHQKRHYAVSDPRSARAIAADQLEILWIGNEGLDLRDGQLSDLICVNGACRRAADIAMNRRGWALRIHPDQAEMPFLLPAGQNAVHLPSCLKGPRSLGAKGPRQHLIAL
jgi:hypothetical protein